MVKAYFFDCIGEQFIIEFETEEEARQFAKWHSLELWNIKKS